MTNRRKRCHSCLAKKKRVLDLAQIIDSGLDQESCFFRDEDGENVEGGFYFNEIAIGSNFLLLDFRGGYFPYDLSRRKV